MAPTYCKRRSTTAFWCAASSGLRSSVMIAGVNSSSDASSDAASSSSSSTPFSAPSPTDAISAPSGSAKALISASLVAPDSNNAPNNSAWRCKFFSLTETPEDYTIILDEEGFKALPASEFLQAVDSAWLVLNVSSNGSAPSGAQPLGVTKIAKSVIGPLAQHSVSVLMLSTYQTDFILVREKDLPLVIRTLAAEFEIYQEVNGEALPAKRGDAANGFAKAKQAVSAKVHPFQSPPNRFCVLSVAPETLPAIATILLDVLFYSRRAAEDSSDGGGAEPFAFFAFSLIEGYISMVMDAETKEKFPSDLLLTSSSGELWRMVRIGGQPLGFDECGIVAQIAEPLADADISAYYISTYNFDHALVPEEGIDHVTQVLQKRQESAR